MAGYAVSATYTNPDWEKTEGYFINIENMRLISYKNKFPVVLQPDFIIFLHPEKNYK